MQYRKIKRTFRIVFVVMLIGAAMLGIYNQCIPDSISVFAKDAELTSINVPFVSVKPDDSYAVAAMTKADECSPFYVSLSADTKLFGVIPLKKVNVDMFSDITLTPGGMPFGVKLFTKGVIVVGISSVETENGNKDPSGDGGLRVGDVIMEIDGKAVNTTDEVSAFIANSRGKSLSFRIDRDGKEHILQIAPVFSKKDNMYKAGLWIRDSTAGIGTVTFISPDNKAFAGLGHGICDVDTGELMPLLKGNVVDVKINGIKKGQVGIPGELKGFFSGGTKGNLIGNTACGVYGTLSELPDTSHSAPMHLGLKNEVKTGEATIYCTIGEKPESFTAEIIKINNNDSEQKNFVIKITDKRLLDATGGIVQGMSGSPIIQNGKLIGAVTHVLVNDPTKGYGIFIENMLKNMPEIMG